MALIKRADQDATTRAAVALDLGDLARQGEMIRAKAREEAARIIEEAKRERERLIATAAQEGRAAGYSQGLEAGRTQGAAEGAERALAERREALAALERMWGEALEAFSQRREQMVASARQDIVRVAAILASKVCRRAIELDPEIVKDQMEAVLRTISHPTRLVLWVHPDDLALARESAPGMLERFDMVRHAELIADASIERGSCVARLEDGGEIDASVGTQIERLVAAMLPGESPRTVLNLGPRAESTAA